MCSLCELMRACYEVKARETCLRLLNKFGFYWESVNVELVFQGEDENSGKKVCVAITKLCHDYGDLELLKSTIVILSKRRAQFPQV